MPAGDSHPVPDGRRGASGRALAPGEAGRKPRGGARGPREANTAAGTAGRPALPSCVPCSVSSWHTWAFITSGLPAVDHESRDKWTKHICRAPRRAGL